MTSNRILIFVITVAAIFSLYLQTSDAYAGEDNEVTQISVRDCKKDADCEDFEVCSDDLRCLHACEKNQCALNAECRAKNHMYSCECFDGHIGNPYDICIKHCNAHENCSNNEICSLGTCIHACTNACGENAICNVRPERSPICSCPAGHTGNPHLGCKKACHFHDECYIGEECNAEHQCVPLCGRDVCGKSAVCVVKNHNRKCVCMPGTTGNPDVECRE